MIFLIHFRSVIIIGHSMAIDIVCGTSYIIYLFAITEKDVSYLSEQKKELDKKKLDMVNTETKISETELKIAELTNELDPITEKIKAIEKLQKNLIEFETKKDKFKNRLLLIFAYMMALVRIYRYAALPLGQAINRDFHLL